MTPSQVYLIANSPDAYPLEKLQAALGEAILRGMITPGENLMLAVSHRLAERVRVRRVDREGRAAS